MRPGPHAAMRHRRATPTPIHPIHPTARLLGLRRSAAGQPWRRRPRRLLRAAVRRPLFPDPAPRQCELGAALQRVLPGGQDAGVQRQPDRPRLCEQRRALCRPRERVRLSPEDRRGLHLQRQGLVRPRAHRRRVRPDLAAGRHRGERRQRQGGADRDAGRQGTPHGRGRTPGVARLAHRAVPRRCRPARSRFRRTCGAGARDRRRCRKIDLEAASTQSARRPPRRSTATR